MGVAGVDQDLVTHPAADRFAQHPLKAARVPQLVAFRPAGQQRIDDAQVGAVAGEALREFAEEVVQPEQFGDQQQLGGALGAGRACLSGGGQRRTVGRLIPADRVGPLNVGRGLLVGVLCLGHRLVVRLQGSKGAIHLSLIKKGPFIYSPQCPGCTLYPNGCHAFKLGGTYRCILPVDRSPRMRSSGWRKSRRFV